MTKLTDAKRVKEVTKGKKLGAIQVLDKSVLKFLVLSTSVTVEDSPKEKPFLGLASNDPTQDKPTLVPQEITSNFTYLVKVEELKNADPDLNKPHGKALKKTDIAKNENAKEEHVLVRECCRLPIPPPYAPMSGRANESTLGTLD